MRTRQTGVEILLVKGTRLPRWIRNQDLNVSVGRFCYNGRWIRKLRIIGGEAHFAPMNRISLRMPGSSQHWASFLQDQVLEIRHLNGELLKRNYFMCVVCVANTGVVTQSRQSTTFYGRDHASLQCQICGHTWEVPEF